MEDTEIIELTFKELTTPNELFCQFDDTNGVLFLDVKKPLTKDDFLTILGIIDPYFAEKGELKGLIVNSKKFPKWTSHANRLEYTDFAIQNQHKFQKAALAVGGIFIRITISLLKSKAHPQIKMFKYNQVSEAQDWILEM